MARLGRFVRRRYLRSAVRLRRRVRSSRLGRWLKHVTLPRSIWAGVIAIVVAYLALERTIPRPSEAELPQLNCMALNIYFEARGESLSGKRAVGHVVMNRVSDAAFPDTVCTVVKQGGDAVRDRCQFSWWCDGKADKPEDQTAWRESREIAWDVMRGATDDPTDGALWYHADYVDPEWRAAMGEGFRIGQHLFYRRPVAEP